MRVTSKYLFSLLFSLIVVTFAFPCFSDLAAQQQETHTPAQPPTEPVAEQAPESNEQLKEQTIYIPYDKLDKVFEQPGRGVFLPYEKFQQLWNRANQQGEGVQRIATPLRSLIKTIDSEAVVRQDVVVVTAKLNVELVGSGWHNVALNLGDAAILSAKVGNGDARIVRNPQGYSLLVYVEEGDADQVSTEQQLELVYAKAFTRTPGLNQLNIQAPRASVNRWKIRVPESGVKIQVAPMIAASEESPVKADDVPEAPQDETVLNAFFGVTPTVVITWTPKAEGASGLQALTTVQAQQMVTIAEGVQRTRGVLNYQISRAELTELKLRVPANQKVTGVFDDNVRQWNVEDKGISQEINVLLHEPAIGSQSMTVELERFDIGLGMEADMQSAVVPIPAIEALNVARQQGIVLVQIGQGLQAEVGARTGLLQIDASEVAGDNWQFAYRYAALPFALDLKVEKVAPEISTNELAVVQISPQRIRAETTVVYEIKRAGVFQLGLLIPEGYRIRNIVGIQVGDAQPVQVDGHQQDEDDPTKYLVNLERKALGKVGLLIDIEKSINGDKNLTEPTGESSEYVVNVPRVDAETVERVDGNIVVYAPLSLRVVSKDVVGARAVPILDAFKTVPLVVGIQSQMQTKHSYEYSAEDFRGTFEITRRQPEVNVDQLLHVDVQSGSVSYTAEFNYQVLYSGVKLLRVDVPTSLKDVINNTNNRIQESELDPQPEDVADGYTAWQLKSSQDLIGNVVISFAWKRDIDSLNVGSNVVEDLPYLAPREVERASGQIVISKAENLDVVPVQAVAQLRSIDPDHDLFNGRTFANANLAFEFHQDWALPVRITRYDLELIRPTAIERSVYRARLDQNNTLTVQAVLLAKSVNQRIEVRFPEGADLSSQPLKINGVESSLEYEGDEGSRKYYVALPNTNSNLPVVVEVNYRVKENAGSVNVLQFDAEETAVHDCYAFVQVPEDWRLTGYDGDWDDYLPGSWMDKLVTRIWGAVSGEEVPTPNDAQIIQNMMSEAGVSLVIEDPLLRTSLVFSSLDPENALNISTIEESKLNLIVFVLIGFVAVVGAASPLRRQVLILVGFLTLSLLVGIVKPLLSAEMFTSATGTTLLFMIGIWAIIDVSKVLWSGASVIRNPSARKSRDSDEENVTPEPVDLEEHDLTDELDEEDAEDSVVDSEEYFTEDDELEAEDDVDPDDEQAVEELQEAEPDDGFDGNLEEPKDEKLKEDELDPPDDQDEDFDGEED